MKRVKIIFALVISSILLCGCESSKNKVVCVGKVVDDGYEMTMRITAKLKDDKVTNATATMTFNDEDTAQAVCGFLNIQTSTNEVDTYECKGNKITIKDFSKVKETSENDKIIGITKEEFINKMTEDEGVTCK